jgi:hypothetical protein
LKSKGGVLNRTKFFIPPAICVVVVVWAHSRADGALDSVRSKATNVRMETEAAGAFFLILFTTSSSPGIQLGNCHGSRILKSY